jgi:mannan endo-1,6-alpha-mannosidase
VWRNRTEGEFFYCEDPYKPTETNKIQKGLLKSSLIFFTGENKTIMFEVGCERNPPDSEGRCNVDQRSFKAYLSRWLAATSILAPWTSEMITPLLRDSALAAAQSCSGGTDGVTCGLKWWVEGWDGDYGVGEQMSALEVIQSNLISRVKGPLSDADGGTSKGDAGAGGGETGIPEGYRGDDLSAKDRKGAAALTVVLVLATLGAAW